MKWITRERPKIDRIACPWLIRKFIDDSPEFLFVPADQVLAIAEREGATPYDIPGVRLSHVGERCSFDAFVSEYQLRTLHSRHLRLSYATRTPAASIWLRKQRDYWRYRSACRDCLKTTTRCSGTAW
jgi:hypothetical protein